MDDVKSHLRSTPEIYIGASIDALMGDRRRVYRGTVDAPMDNFSDHGKKGRSPFAEIPPRFFIVSSPSTVPVYTLVALGSMRAYVSATGSIILCAPGTGFMTGNARFCVLVRDLNPSTATFIVVHGGARQLIGTIEETKFVNRDGMGLLYPLWDGIDYQNSFLEPPFYRKFYRRHYGSLWTSHLYRKMCRRS